MAYQVLARSWRPQRFADLIGQDAVVRTLQNALTAGTLGQAYLFSGLRGVGKTTAARLLAKAVNCETGPTAEPCGECLSCRDVTAGASLDVVELDAATHTGVDDVRELQELLRYRPVRDRYRVLIVDEVHMLSKSAFNALLKTIEEPPPYILWIFATTERHKVPATILSRCQQLEFRPVSTPQIAAHLGAIAEREAFVLSAEAAAAVARAAAGSVRDALSLVDQLRAFSGDAVDEAAVSALLGVPPFERTVELVTALAAGQAGDAVQRLQAELEAGHDATVLYEEVGRVLRLLVHHAIAPTLDAGLSADHRELLAGPAKGVGATGLIRMLGLWLEQEGLMREAANRELALEVACLRLSRWPAVQQVESLLEAGGGSTPPKAPAGGGRRPAGAAGGGVQTAPADPGTPGERLAAALWDGRPRLAAAVEGARVAVAEGCAELVFPAAARRLADVARTPDLLGALRAACRDLFPGVSEVIVTVEGETAGEADGLAATAAADPGVRAVLQVLGGELTGVKPADGEAVS